MALYKTVSWDELDSLGKMAPSPFETRIYDAFSRNIDANDSNDNFFTKRGKSIENAIGTTGAAIVSGIDSARENAKANAVSDNIANNLDKIAQKYGFADRGAYWDALSAAEESGNTDELERLNSTVGAEMRGETSSAAKETDQAAKNWKEYRENSYVGQKINQDRGKFAGSAINTLSTAFDVMAPGAGVLANSVQGGIEGIADELEQNGLENFDWERAGQNALTGAATGAVTGALNKGISNKLAKNGGNLFKGGNALTRGLNNLGSQTAAGRIGSTLATGAARGALSGAVGGATGASLSAAMNGQDVLGSAIQGAQQGFGQGALAGGVMAGASMAANAAKNKIRGVPTSDIQEAETVNKVPEQTQTPEDDLGIAPAFEPEERIQSRNKLQSIGDQLKNAAQTQKYSALYDSLDGKTAQRAIETGVVDKLASMGVKPENYLEAAKTSNYVNDVVDKLAKNSEIKAMVPDLTNRLSIDNVDLLMPDTAVKKYNSYINQIVADGSTPDQYSAGYLLQKSRELGKAAQKVKTSRVEGAEALSQALRDAKYTLRDIAADALQNAEITGNMTNDQIRQGLAKLGANEKVQNYYTESVDGKAPTIGDYIRRSSDFEQARDMGTQMEAEKYTRSASKAPTNPMTKLWSASGLEQPTNVVLKNAVAPVASGVTKLAGKVVGGVGDAAAKVSNVLGGGDSIASTTTDNANAGYNPSTRIFNEIGRTEGLTNAEQARTANYLVDAAQEAETVPSNNTLESMVSPTSTTNTSVYNSVYGNNGQMPNTGQTTNNQASTQSSNSYFPTTGDYWTDILGKAMSAAIEADDVAAFASLYGMYQDSLANLQKQQKSSTSSQKLTATQQRANAAMDSLDRLSQMTPDLGYNLSGIPVIGNIATLGGNDYDGEAKSLAQQIGYMVSGANIKEEEAYNIGKAYVPQPFDSEQTRNLKLQRAYNIIRQYQNGTAEE